MKKASWLLLTYHYDPDHFVNKSERGKRKEHLGPMKLLKIYFRRLTSLDEIWNQSMLVKGRYQNWTSKPLFETEHKSWFNCICTKAKLSTKDSECQERKRLKTDNLLSVENKNKRLILPFWLHVAYTSN